MAAETNVCDISKANGNGTPVALPATHSIQRTRLLLQRTLWHFFPFFSLFLFSADESGSLRSSSAAAPPQPLDSLLSRCRVFCLVDSLYFWLEKRLRRCHSNGHDGPPVHCHSLTQHSSASMCPALTGFQKDKRPRRWAISQTRVPRAASFASNPMRLSKTPTTTETLLFQMLALLPLNRQSFSSPAAVATAADRVSLFDFFFYLFICRAKMMKSSSKMAHRLSAA